MLFPLRLVDPEGPQEDNTTDTNKSKQINGELCLLVIVETVRRQFSFGGGRNRCAP